LTGITRGRFAPSPTGPLHLGSLVTAVASYLDAKALGGQWLVRIEDVDTPRTVPGAADAILRSLEAHGLEWDGASGVMVQSQRIDAYREALAQLGAHVYPCGCSRREIASGTAGEIRYPGICRAGLPAGREARAYRVRVPDDRTIAYEDRLIGKRYESLETTCGDFVLLRADGIFAYQLAVVVDDAEQGITDVVRGVDLLDSTARQVYLYELLGSRPVPKYLHVPVVREPVSGEKLSKQTNAPPLDDLRASDSLWLALEFLSQDPPADLRRARPTELLGWGVAHWNPQRLSAGRGCSGST
jgi:glutamyl-Q tRNA(Asp) synthetase